MFNKTLLVCDMDGTLLDSSCSISRENIIALTRFTEHGGLFTVATGRMPQMIDQFMPALPINAPAILYNGAMIYDFSKREILWENHLPYQARDIISLLSQTFPGAGIEIYYEDKIVLISENSETDKHNRGDTITVQKMQIENIPFPWIKILIAWDNGNLKKIEQWLADINPPFRFTFSSDVFLELLENKTSKGEALDTLIRKLSIPRENVYAVGDNLNDIEMIQAAGTGIAVANAHPDLIKAADACVSHNDDHAIAHIISMIEKGTFNKPHAVK
jgi:Cof subfamily protein (haloacid dehalogenase superfamily)